MRRLFICTIALPLLLSAGNSALAQKKRSATPHAPGEDIYKHYTGTIGQRKVVVDVIYGYQGASNYGGSHFYDTEKEGVGTLIIYEPATFDHGVPMKASEQADDTTLGDANGWNETPMPKWDFTIAGENMKGRWHSADGKRHYNIDLSENYKESVALDLMVVSDTSAERDASGRRPLKGITYVGIKPAAAASNEDAEYVTSQALEFVNAGDIRDLQQYYRAYTRRYVLEPLPAGAKIFSEQLYPVYNDNGILVLKHEVLMMGGNSIASTFAYLSMDMRSHSRIEPDDMLDVNSAKLAQMLESAVRNKYGLAPGVKLSTWLLRDKVPVARNMYPGHKGIFFTYNPGELVKDKAITVFLSYDQLSVLNKSFRKRVG
ncbi:MAG: hypothetical protein V4649_05365 [Bacteroidota bacterium]